MSPFDAITSAIDSDNTILLEVEVHVADAQEVSVDGDEDGENSRAYYVGEKIYASLTSAIDPASWAYDAILSMTDMNEIDFEDLGNYYFDKFTPKH